MLGAIISMASPHSLIILPSTLTSTCLINAGPTPEFLTTAVKRSSPVFLATKTRGHTEASFYASITLTSTNEITMAQILIKNADNDTKVSILRNFFIVISILQPMCC
jgi:hypothetical protein